MIDEINAELESRQPIKDDRVTPAELLEAVQHIAQVCGRCNTSQEFDNTKCERCGVKL